LCTECLRRISTKRVAVLYVIVICKPPMSFKFCTCFYFCCIFFCTLLFLKSLYRPVGYFRRDTQMSHLLGITEEHLTLSYQTTAGFFCNDISNCLVKAKPSLTAGYSVRYEVRNPTHLAARNLRVKDPVTIGTGTPPRVCVCVCVCVCGYVCVSHTADLSD